MMLTDAAIEANASTIAVAIMESRVATQFGDDMIAVLSVISERNPPAASAAERQFLRDAIAMADQAEIMAGRRDRETPC